MMTSSIPAALVAALIPMAAASSTGPGRAAEPQAAGAPAASLPVKNMTVEIWPEYDDPRVLVMYRGDVADPAMIPADFTLTIPAGAQVHMAGGVDPQGGHIHGLYEAHERDDGLMDISYTLEVPSFYMEFYYDPFSGDDRREFTYPVVAPADVGRLVVSVQQPLRSQGFAVTPSATRAFQDDRGFLYQVVEKADVAAGTSTPVSVSYTKTDREPSVTPPQGGGTGAGTSDGRTMKNILSFAAVLLVGVAGYALFFSSRRRDGDEHAHEVRSSGQAVTTGRVARFCTQCGHPVTPDDRFCGTCGHPTHAADLKMAGASAADPHSSNL